MLIELRLAVGRVLGHRVLAEQRLGLLLQRLDAVGVGVEVRHRDGAAAALVRDGAEVRAATDRWWRRTALRESPAFSAMSTKSGSLKLDLARLVRSAGELGERLLHLGLQRIELLLPLRASPD